MPDLHESQPVLRAGEPLDKARAAMILIHGRGATAEDILSLRYEFDQPGFAYIAPQAANNTWYPNRFIAPIESNEPYLSSALAMIDSLVKSVIQAGVPMERLVLLGFSQGACLALEYAARNTGQYGGVIGLSGGLIGPDGTPRDYPGNLAGTPVFLGCSDVDAHVPKVRVEESAAAFERLGASVTMRIYPNMGHTINQDELDFVRSILSGITS